VHNLMLTIHSQHQRTNMYSGSVYFLQPRSTLIVDIKKTVVDLKTLVIQILIFIILNI
jgi:hypothetical protein